MSTRCVTTVLLLLTASPALASDGHPDATVPAGDRADAGHLAAEVRDLGRRVTSLERKVERLEAATRPREETRIERERRAEFLRHVWNDA